MVFLGKRYAALLEVCLVSLILTFVWWFYEAYLEHGMFWYFGFPKFIMMLIPKFMMLIALLAIILPRRSFRIYGFLPRSPRFTLKWSSAFIAVFILPAALSIGVSAALGAAKPAGLSPLSIILNLIFNMIFIGLVEEAYFRGYVQSRLNEVFERRWRRFIFKAWKVDYGM
ncbi:MAG: CPBP family glutamic-type intramembrane protease, partial [Candidatus Bathyarchaeia archaeon]